MKALRSLPALALLLGGVVFGTQLHAQKDRSWIEELPRQNVAASFGFSFIPSAQDIGTSQANGLFVPTVGLDYSLRVARRWGSASPVQGSS